MMRRLKMLINSCLVMAYGYSAYALADGDYNGGIGQLAQNMMASLQPMGKLFVAIAYVAGIGFTMGAIYKFKQHRDNPTQIPLGTPIAMLTLGIGLVFLPDFFAPAGMTVFGTTSGAGGFTGGGVNIIPGGV